MHPVLDSGLYPQPLNHPHFPALHHPAMSAAADTASLYHHHHPQQQNQQQHLQNFPPDPYSQQHSNYVSSAVLEASSMYSAENYQPIHGSTLATSISTSKPQITKSNTKSSPTTSVPVFPSPPAAASIKFESTAAAVSQKIKPKTSSAANSPNNSILATSTTTTSTKSALDSTLEFPQQQSASGKLINTSKNLRNVAAQQQTTSSSSSLLSANNSAVAAAYYAAAIANPDTTTSTNFYSSGNHYFNGTDSLIPEGLPLPPYYPTNPGMMMQGYGIGPDELMNISPLYAGSGLSSSTAHLHYESESSGSYVGGCSSWPQYYMESSSIPLTNEKGGDPSGTTMGTVGSQLLPPYMDVRNDFYSSHPSLQQGINQSNIDPFPTVLPGVLGQGNPAAADNNHIYGNSSMFPDSATTSALLHTQPQHLMSLDQQFTPNYVDPMHQPTATINPYDSNCGVLSNTSTAYVSTATNQLELLQPANSKLSNAPTPGKIKGASSSGSTRRHRSTTKRSAAVITPVPLESRSGGGVADKSASSTSTSGWPHNFSNLSGHSSSLSPTGSSGMAKMPRKSRSRSSAMNKEDSEMGDDDLGSNEDKEMDRRMANNTRERIRVRDINQAFKELAKLCSQHMPNTEERGLTKLGTLLKAVDLIPMLEEKVRARNLDPRMATMKRSNQNHQSMAPSNSSFQLGITDAEATGGGAAKIEQTNSCVLTTNQQML